MSYPFYVTLVCPNLKSIFNTLNVVISIFGQQKHLTLEIEPCDFLMIFLRFWPFEPHFLINVFLIKYMKFHFLSGFYGIAQILAKNK